MRISVAFAYCIGLLACLVDVASADVTRTDVRSMMERSGLVALLADEAERMKETFPEIAAGQIRPDLIPPLADLLERSWNGQRLIADLEAAYVDILTPDGLKAINAFLDTPLSKRFVEAEAEAIETPAVDEIARRRDELIALLQKDPARSEIIHKIDKIVRVTDLAATISMSMARAMIVGGTRNLDPELRRHVEEAFEALRPTLVEEVRKSVLGGLAWTYRDFSVDELRDYADFLMTDAARAMNGTFFAVANDHYTAVGTTFGEGIAALLKQKGI